MAWPHFFCSNLPGQYLRGTSSILSVTRMLSYCCDVVVYYCVGVVNCHDAVYYYHVGVVRNVTHDDRNGLACVFQYINQSVRFARRALSAGD